MLKKESGLGLLASDTVFMNMGGWVIYCTPRGGPALMLTPYNTFNNVLWLKDGDLAFFIESSAEIKFYCVLDLTLAKCYKRSVSLSNAMDDEIENLSGIKVFTNEEAERLGYSEFNITEVYLAKNYKSNILSRWL